MMLSLLSMICIYFNLLSLEKNLTLYASVVVYIYPVPLCSTVPGNVTSLGKQTDRDLIGILCSKS
uniref:Uncharacterized protein n=1 Tax=Setaria viridis TaxID=4556 RepID=A0A4U6TND2_SETVI|nr:hypothetical protein SEVIR_7G037758v2 [Setaria viridis]